MKKGFAALTVVILAAVAVAGAFWITQNLDDDGDGRFTLILGPQGEGDLEPMTYAEAREYWDGTSAETERILLDPESGYDDLEQSMIDITTCYYDIVHDYYLVYWQYNRDPSAMEDEYVKWSDLTVDLELYDEIYKKGLQGPNSDTIREIVGDDAADRFLASSVPTEEEMDLSRRENALVSAYYTAYAENDVTEVTDVFLELIQVRNRIAEINGYGSYADYAYEVTYQRGYTPDDVETFKGIVMKYAPTLYFEVLSAINGNRLSMDYTYSGEDQLLEDVAPFIRSICPEFGELYDYMVGYGLIDAEDLPTKNNLGYTSGVQDVNLVYIFTKPVGTFDDVSTLVHEFGHAASRSLVYGPSYDLDVNETQSQGLEALLMIKSEEYFGIDGDAYAMDNLLSFLYVLIDACIQDEFQQRVYGSGAETAEQISAIYNGVWRDFGLATNGMWFMYPHTFENPFYYISYGISVFNALEIFVDGLDDYDAAVDKYLDVVAYTGGYADMADTLGIRSAFDADDFTYIFERLGDYVESV